MLLILKDIILILDLLLPLTSSDCQCTTCHCNISLDVTSFDINYNCLEYNVNYLEAIYLVNYCDERERSNRFVHKIINTTK